jgi:hypothetical protein
MKKLFLLIFVFMAMNLAMKAVTTPKDSTATLYKISSGDITVDGDSSDIGWTNATKYNILRVFPGDAFASASDCSGFFKAAWDENGLYVLLSVTDNIHYAVDPDPSKPYGQDYEKDKGEIYLNLNVDSLKKEHGIGYSGGNSMGYFWVAPVADESQSIPPWALPNGKLVIKLSGTNYVEEVFIPWSNLKYGSNTDKLYNPLSGIRFGLDVTIADNDGPSSGKPARRRLGWINNAVYPSKGENYSTMAHAGFAMLSTSTTTNIQPINDTKFIISVTNDFLKLRNVKPGIISIYNVTGQEIMKISNRDINSEIEISNLKSGIYFIRTNDRTQKFIKR